MVMCNFLKVYQHMSGFCIWLLKTTAWFSQTTLWVKKSKSDVFLYNWLLLFKHSRKDGEYGPFTDLSVNARLREHFITTWTLAETGRENYTDDAVIAYLLAKKFTGPWLRLITGPRSAGSTSTWWSGIRLLTLEKIIWCLSDICQTVTSCWINTCENFLHLLFRQFLTAQEKSEWMSCR